MERSPTLKPSTRRESTRKGQASMTSVSKRPFPLGRPSSSGCKFPIAASLCPHLTASRGWKKLTVCLIVEAIALGSLSIPSVFKQTGMVAGVLLCVGLGLIAIYTSYLVGQVKLKYPEIEHYPMQLDFAGEDSARS